MGLTKFQAKQDNQAVMAEAGFYKGEVDGIWGKQSRAAYAQYLQAEEAMRLPQARRAGFVADAEPALRAAYGPAGDESRLVRVRFPWAARYEGDPVGSCRFHEAVAPVFEAAFRDLWQLAEVLANGGVYFGCKTAQQVVDFWDISNYSGTFNNRPISAGSRPSTHARGLSIDLDAGDNPNLTEERKPNTGGRFNATMPERVLHIFAQHGLKSGGRAWGRDYMHVQATL